MNVKQYLFVFYYLFECTVFHYVLVCLVVLH